MRLRFAIAGKLRGKVPRTKEDTGTGRRRSARRGADVQRSRPGGCRRPADYSEISAAGPRAAWGLGTTGQSSYVAHWNGKRWTRMPVPPHLYGVAISGLSTSDVWLAGWLSGTDNRQGLVYRWNGHSWIRMLRGVDLGTVIAIRPADGFRPARQWPSPALERQHLDRLPEPVRARSDRRRRYATLAHRERHRRPAPEPAHRADMDGLGLAHDELAASGRCR